MQQYSNFIQLLQLILNFRMVWIIVIFIVFINAIFIFASQNLFLNHK